MIRTKYKAVILRLVLVVKKLCKKNKRLALKDQCFFEALRMTFCQKEASCGHKPLLDEMIAEANSCGAGILV